MYIVFPCGFFMVRNGLPPWSSKRRSNILARISRSSTLLCTICHLAQLGDLAGVAFSGEEKAAEGWCAFYLMWKVVVSHAIPLESSL